MQFLLLSSGRTRALCNRWYLGFLCIYWITLALSGFISAIGYAFTPKPDCVAVEVLSFLVGSAGIGTLFMLQRGLIQKPLEAETREPLSYSDAARVDDNRVFHVLNRAHHSTRGQRCCMTFWRISNRILKVIHWIFSVMFMAGAINLALQYRFSNPGTLIQITLPTNQTQTISYNCTTVASSSKNTTTLPTIWFEADAAHGIVDFLGVQNHLALTHARNSCSYDPPNFGWSGRLPSNIDVNFSSVFNPLIEALGKQNEEKVMVGWGAGAENALSHTIKNANSTRALVILDASPDGIEWFDMQRAKNWTEQQMLDFRATDLAGRIFLAQIILALGVPWGLLPLFLPPTPPSSYFSPPLIPRYRAQASKEDMWALQHTTLQLQARSPISTYLLTTTVPASMKIYAVLTLEAGSNRTDEKSNEFVRSKKLELVNHISAGGNLTRPVVWCAEADCDLKFPVTKAGWTADTIVGLGV